MTPRPQPISDRIAAWKQAFDSVIAELDQDRCSALWCGAPRSEHNPDGTKWARHSFVSVQDQWQIELAARTAATLAIGATTRERGE